MTYDGFNISTSPMPLYQFFRGAQFAKLIVHDHFSIVIVQRKSDVVRAQARWSEVTNSGGRNSLKNNTRLEGLIMNEIASQLQIGLTGGALN